jgi:uncharacterized PurR-regulated membrane protein YhhQ (DUF165 family)
VEFNGELVQKMDPVFMDPGYNFIKAHFYSPTKKFLGIFFDTYIVNVIVLWIMTILLYIALYNRLLRKILDSGAAITGKRKGSDRLR